MKPITHYLWVLAICLVLVPRQIGGHTAAPASEPEPEPENGLVGGKVVAENERGGSGNTASTSEAGGEVGGAEKKMSKHVAPKPEKGGAGGIDGMHLVEEVCEKTASKDTCVRTLKADPLVHRLRSATAKDLAISFLRMTSRNASLLIYELKALIEDDTLSPEVQQGLSDCKDMLMDASDQLEIAATAFLTQDSYDAKTWLQIALDAADTCENSLKSGNEKVMLKKNDAFRDLCLIGSAICKQL